MMKLINLNLRSKLITAFLLVSVLAGGLIAFTANRTTSQALTDEVGNNLQRLADTQALAVGDLLARQTDALQSLSLNRSLREFSADQNANYLNTFGGDQEAILASILEIDEEWVSVGEDDLLIRRRLFSTAASELQTFRNLFPDQVEVFFTDEYGGLAAATDRTSDYYQADEEWWQIAYNDGEGAIYIGQPSFDESSQTFGLNMAVPIYDRERETILGILRSTYSLETLADLVLETESVRTGFEIGILLPNDQFLISNEGRMEAADETLLANLQGLEEAQYAEIEINGAVNLISQAQVTDITGVSGVDDLGWQIVVFQDELTALEPVNNQRRNILLTTFLVTIGAAVAAVFMANLLANPISRLTDTAADIAGGNLSARADVDTGDEIGLLSNTFNTMADQLQETLAGLEDRVEERTSQLAERSTQLETAAIVARDVTSVLEFEDLLERVAVKISESFGHYHVAIFLADEQDQQAVLRAASSEGGQKMLARRHTLQAGNESIIGYVLANKRHRLVADVNTEDVYFQNPDLPQTQSEIALPLQAGGYLLGVLDVQSKEKDSFSPDDITILQTLADQIAVAIYNSQLFENVSQARQEAEEANRIKTQFLTNMSHELRTPLNAILNFTGFVADGVLGEVNDEQVDSLNKTITSGEHLLSLINDILDLSKIEAGKMSLFVQDVNMNHILDSAAATAKGLIKEKPISLTVDIEPNLPELKGDKRRIRQVMLNLVSNAVKFTPEGEIHIAAGHEDSNIHISVRDTGIGISQEDMKKVFNSFEQIEHELYSVSGTGLGLPISKHFVEAHNGQMWAESELGVGSTFYVTFPVESEIPETAPALASNGYPAQE